MLISPQSQAVFTFLVTVYIFVSELSVPQAYNKWLLLVLEVVTLIFWLSAFASLAALAANIDACLDMVESYSGLICRQTRYRKRTLEKRAGVWDIKTAREWYAVLAAASGIGAIILYVVRRSKYQPHLAMFFSDADFSDSVICIILLTVFCRALQRHRVLTGAAAATSSGAPAELNSPSVPMQNVAVAGAVPEKTDQPPISPVSPPMSPPQQPAQTYAYPQYGPTPTHSPPPQLPTHTYPPPQVYSQSPTYSQPQARPHSQLPSMPYQHTGPSDTQQLYQQHQHQQPSPPGTHQGDHSSFTELSATPRIPEGRPELRS